jgi:hypothetical protein
MDCNRNTENGNSGTELNHFQSVGLNNYDIALNIWTLVGRTPPARQVKPGMYLVHQEQLELFLRKEGNSHMKLVPRYKSEAKGG